MFMPMLVTCNLVVDGLRNINKKIINRILVSSAVSGVTITKKVRVYGQVLYGVQAIVYDLYCKKGEQDGVR